MQHFFMYDDDTTEDPAEEEEGEGRGENGNEGIEAAEV